ncbi:MAG: NAD-dependent epimerase/dehydratase family protein [Steroidobacteraceae bacterium]
MTANRERISAASVAVTGASGFVGRRLVAALLRAGARVHAYGRRSTDRFDGAPYQSWDIALAPLAAAPPVDAVLHCAGLVTDWADDAEFDRCHVTGTRNVLASFSEPCAVIHISTASVYDLAGEKRLLSEDEPPARRYLNRYSESKAAAELLVRVRSRNIILRPHAIYGPGDRVLLPRLLQARVWGRQIAVGDGSNLISLTHVDNLVDAALLSLDALLSGGPCAVFNIADETPVAVDSALRAIFTAARRNPRVIYLPRHPAYVLGAIFEWLYKRLRARTGPRLTRYRVAHIADEFTLDLTRAKSVLGYRPSRSLESFIAEGGLTDR